MNDDAILTLDMLQEFKKDFPALWNEFDHLFFTKQYDDLIQIYRFGSTRSSQVREFLFCLLDSWRDLLVNKDFDSAWLIREVIDSLIFLIK